jgi:homoserine dehydrogenase
VLIAAKTSTGILCESTDNDSSFESMPHVSPNAGIRCKKTGRRVQTYLANRHNATQLTDDVRAAKRELKAAHEQKLAAERARSEQRQRLNEAEENHRSVTYGLRDDIRKQHEAQKDAACRINGANDAVQKAENELATTADSMFQARAALGSHWDFMASVASGIPLVPTAQYAAEQTKRLTELCAAVADEPGRST